MIGFPGSDLSKVIIPHLNFKADVLYMHFDRTRFYQKPGSTKDQTTTQVLPVMAGNSNGLVLVSDQLFSSTQEDELAEFDGSQSLPLVSN
jgi:hypothetical protein